MIIVNATTFMEQNGNNVSHNMEGTSRACVVMSWIGLPSSGKGNDCGAMGLLKWSAQGFLQYCWISLKKLCRHHNLKNSSLIVCFLRWRGTGLREPLPSWARWWDNNGEGRKKQRSSVTLIFPSLTPKTTQLQSLFERVMKTNASNWLWSLVANSCAVILMSSIVRSCLTYTLTWKCWMSA